jgi:Fe-S cluster assembly protein SufD
VATPGAVDAETLRTLGMDARTPHQLVMVDGHFSAALSQLASLPAALRVLDLNDRAAASELLVRAHFGTLAAAQQYPIAALNTALGVGGVLLHATAQDAEPIAVHVLHVATSAQAHTACYPRTLIICGAGARLALRESFVSIGNSASLIAPVMECFVADAAELQLVRLQDEGPSHVHLSYTAVQLARDARFTANLVSFGGRIGRTELSIALSGPGSSCNIDGLYVADGAQHLDHTLHIAHMAPHCSSSAWYRGVLAGKSSSVFNGKVRVHPGARGTNALQQNRNLLLSKKATANTRPQLEIDNDDVRCAHGATVGQLDEDQVFYLRARGLSERDARQILTHAFAAMAFASIADAESRDELDQRLTRRLLPMAAEASSP